ncbi:MAG: dipicolinate synthase subunit DpsA [Eubacteriales bacterium]
MTVLKKPFVMSVIGGDSRQLYIAELLKDRNIDLRYYGVAAEGAENTCGTPEEAIAGCDAVLLPLPVTRDGYRLNMSGDLFFFDFARMISPGTFVFAGMIPPSFKDFLEQSGIKYYDYFESRRLLWDNADITAEGAVSLLMRELPKTVRGAEILVCGFGRIGKLLAGKLTSLGASVTVAARRDDDLLLAEKCFGVKTDPINYRRIGTFDLSKDYDAVLNTVPSWIFDESNAPLLRKTIYIELASSPYGGETEFMRKNCAKYIMAAGLPGKYAPREAARAIVHSLLNYLSEEGKDT